MEDDDVLGLVRVDDTTKDDDDEDTFFGTKGSSFLSS
jgi:hypothetical protein